MRRTLLFTALGLVFAGTSALAAELVIPINAINTEGVGAIIGSVKVKDGKGGMTVTPKLSGLTPGPHGFHVHENPSCQPKEQDGKMVPGLSAGGHFDPAKAGKHEGPWGHGHQGDLPALAVNGDGNATDAVVASMLKVADLKGRAIVIHAGADNYSDQPKPLGGGGGRVACGVVPSK
ncbi:Superoxide dismutase Cu-Zn precursor [Paramagnetospirillum magnetotacticum MS-1]|uniref:Superoxide dismutase [Cu-Zn] n=1 Tax=Paramagnetospirillum magnetotacticum MS-1 TaxID=272627 RepID=A0A0C2YFE5_PARME|nr:superoxide dismutase family protein [Paramagnetospirillum magnetotacticum]KIL98429.1 Superoxide dismutase Cu-Zn precursor [Paramagnetospirillum magnetotacticum MS-1]